MTDIVDTLRRAVADLKEEVPDSFGGVRSKWPEEIEEIVSPEMLEAAADEIDRLRSALAAEREECAKLKWISEGDDLPPIAQPVLLCSPRQHEEFWDLRVACILVRHEGVAPIPVKAGSRWPTDYYWSSPARSVSQDTRLITGNAWWAFYDNINLPPRAFHCRMGPRSDRVILQDGDVWVGKGRD